MACPQASRFSPDVRHWLSDHGGHAVAALLACYVLLLGGRLTLFYADADLAWLSLALVLPAAVAGYAGLWRQCRLSPLLALLALGWLGWTALTARWAIYPRAGYEALLWTGLQVGLFFAGARLASSREGVARSTGALLPGIAVVALWGLLQAVGVLPLEALYLTERHRPRLLSTLNHPNNLAGFVALVLPLVLAWSLSAWRARRRAQASAGLGLGLVLLFCAAATYSRGGQLGVAVGGMAWLLLLPTEGIVGWLRRHPRRAAAAVAVLVVLAVGFVASPLGLRLRLGLGNLGRFSQDERMGTWLAAATMVRGEPLHGVGPGCFWLAFPTAKTAQSHALLFTHAHDWYLHVAAEQGLAGLALLLTLLLAVAAFALRRGEGERDEGRRLALAGCIAGLLGFGVASLLDVNVGVPAIALVFWYVLGVAASAEHGERHRGIGLAATVALLGTLALFGVWSVWNRGHAHYNACVQQVAQGHVAAAARELELARRLDPTQVVYRLVRVDLAELAGRTDLSLAELTQLQREGLLRDAAYRVLLAYRLAGAGRMGEARELLVTLGERDEPAQPVVPTDLGWLTMDSDPAGAARALERAARNERTFGARVGLAELARRAGRPDEAARWLDDALSLVPNRDRVPRFLVGYGRLDPLALTPTARRGQWPQLRYVWQGTLVPALTAELDRVWCETVTPPAAAASKPAVPAAAAPR